MKTMKKCNRKLLSILLVLCMVLTIVPITALAAEWENLDFLPQGVTHSTECKNPYHTQVNVTANVIVKGSDGTVVETTQVSKSSEDFVKGNLNDEAVLTALANLQTEIETPYKAKGTVTSENGGGQLTVDHFESATFYIFTPTSGDPVDFSTDLDAAKQYFNDHTDAVGTFTRILDVHEYLKWDYTYDLIVQKPSAVDEEVITTVDIGNIWKKLDSSQPVVFTTELNPNTDCPNQMEITDQAWVENDSSASISSNAYPEAGKEYVYEITLTAKEGYYFPTYGTVFYGEVIVDGVEKYSYGHGDAVPNVYDNGKTLKVNAMRQKEHKRLEQAVEQGTKRIAEIDRLIEKVFEQNAIGVLSDERFSKMLQSYEKEQKALTQEVAESRQTLEEAKQKATDLRLLLRTLREMTEINELTPTLVNSLIERIEVHNNDKSSGHCYVKVDIYFTAVGMIDIPTEQEILAMMEEIRANPQDFRFVA